MHESRALHGIELQAATLHRIWTRLSVTAQPTGAWSSLEYTPSGQQTSDLKLI